MSAIFFLLKNMLRKKLKVFENQDIFSTKFCIWYYEVILQSRKVQRTDIIDIVFLWIIRVFYKLSNSTDYVWIYEETGAEGNSSNAYFEHCMCTYNNCNRKISHVFVIQKDCGSMNLISIFKTITLMLDFSSNMNYK